MAAVANNLNEYETSSHFFERPFVFANPNSSDDSAVGSSRYSSSGENGLRKQANASEKVDVRELLAKLEIEGMYSSSSPNVSFACEVYPDDALDDDHLLLIPPPPSKNSSILSRFTNAFSNFRQKFHLFFYKKKPPKLEPSHINTLGSSPKASNNPIEDSYLDLKPPSSEDSGIGNSSKNTSSHSDASASSTRTAKSQKYNSIQDVQQFLAKLRAEAKNRSPRFQNKDCIPTPIDSTDDLDDIAYCDFVRKKLKILEARASSYCFLSATPDYTFD